MYKMKNRSSMCSKATVILGAGVESIQGKRNSMEDTSSFSSKFLSGMSLTFRTIRIKKNYIYNEIYRITNYNYTIYN